MSLEKRIPSNPQTFLLIKAEFENMKSVTKNYFY